MSRSFPTKRQLLLCGALLVASLVLFANLPATSAPSSTRGRTQVPGRARRTFGVVGDQFVRDGAPYRVVSGAFHYFRTPRELWADRLRKMRLGGLNTVETYVPWNLHEPARGKLVFEGDLDLLHFIDLAEREGLLVIVRPPPYICAEWEFGGLPAWILRDRGVVLRSSDPRFLVPAQEFLKHLAAMLVPRLYSRGGPVVAVQVENEYGSYSDDLDYLDALESTLRRSGIDCVLFNSNGYWPRQLANGAGRGQVLRAVNFGLGGNATMAFEHLRDAQKHGPLFVAEFWDGWFDHWGERHHTAKDDAICAVLDQILAAGASVNIYMYVGGTNFGLMNGANSDARTGALQPTVTSYDYDSPVGEAGDVTTKWLRIREVLGRYLRVPSDPSPAPAPKTAYGPVKMAEWASLLDASVLRAFSAPVSSTSPLSFTDLSLDYGFVLYETTVPAIGQETERLTIAGVHDRATVWVGDEPRLAGSVDSLTSSGESRTLRLPRGPGGRLRVLVENCGRVNYGKRIGDEKGIMGPVLLGEGLTLRNWTQWALPLTSLPSALAFSQTTPGPSTPAFHRGRFVIDGEPTDTFLDTRGWNKGLAYVNGRCLGRFWPSKGPQATLYVPAPFLRRGGNEVVVFDVESEVRVQSYALFVDKHVLG
eukprot:m51a1_g2987 putative beta-galactosidase (648) ;mRNA; r:736398-739068